CLLKPNPECDGKRDCADGSDEMNCGVKNRIVGGEDARSGKWPWQASLQMGAHGHVCGASVISNRWLISAAHCFLDSDSVRYEQTLIIHFSDFQSMYDQSISDYDIALLEMETSVFFSELVQPICLPSTSRIFVYGTVCYVTGWGAIKENSHLAKTLQEARVRIINQSVCNKLYDDLITSRMLCAGNLNGGVDACQGDSGGPLACMGKGNRWYLAGIVSWGEGCARRNRPGVYTKVTKSSQTSLSQIFFPPSISLAICISIYVSTYTYLNIHGHIPYIHLYIILVMLQDSEHKYFKFLGNTNTIISIVYKAEISSFSSYAATARLFLSGL
uniref:Peptidase S1 domain-containing protein n=1 Tax=Accipiter nisus TaxID=211598 RepID=A0A8B9NNA9_9AVES